ncbi:hypothetical protein [Escherichia phage vB_EcoM-LTH01]
MSDNRLTIGVIAKLEPDSPAIAWENDPHIQLTYDGKMVVYVHDEKSLHDAYGVNLLDDYILQSFFKGIERAGAKIVKDSQKVFVEVWYDGSDPGYLSSKIKDIYGEDYEI